MGLNQPFSVSVIFCSKYDMLTKNCRKFAGPTAQGVLDPVIGCRPTVNNPVDHDLRALPGATSHETPLPVLSRCVSGVPGNPVLS